MQDSCAARSTVSLGGVSGPLLQSACISATLLWSGRTSNGRFWKRDRDWRSLDAGSANNGAPGCGLAMDEMDAMRRQTREGGCGWSRSEARPSSDGQRASQWGGRSILQGLPWAPPPRATPLASSRKTPDAVTALGVGQLDVGLCQRPCNKLCCSCR